MGRSQQQEKDENVCVDISPSAVEQPDCERSGSKTAAKSLIPSTQANSWEEIPEKPRPGTTCGPKASASTSNGKNKGNSSRRKNSEKRLRNTFADGFEHKERDRKELCERLFLTRSGEDYKAPKDQTRTPMHLKSKPENVGSVHAPFQRGGVGAQHNLISRAPLFNRRMCTYTSEFKPRSLAGIEITKAAYDLQKLKNEATSLGPGPMGQLKLMGESESRRIHSGFLSDVAKRALRQPFRPEKIEIDVPPLKQNLGISIAKSSYHSRSLEQMRFARPRPFHPPECLGKILSAPSFCGTSYQRDFDAAKYCEEIVGMMHK